VQQVSRAGNLMKRRILFSGFSRGVCNALMRLTKFFVRFA
jgi:hypothetical protein